MNYLLDHLYRYTKISRRTTVKTSVQECVFDLSKHDHQSSWLSVFDAFVEHNDENVPSPFDAISFLLLTICCRNASGAQ